MQLVLDIGNTRTKFGLFRGEQLVQHGVWEKPELAEQEPWYTSGQVSHGLLSFSGPGQWPLPNHIDWLTLSAETRLPFENRYATPQSLGRDRLALAAGAQAAFPEEDVLVVDLGTCITYEFLEAGKTYLGGAISPGWRLRMYAMHEFTSALPLIEDLPAPAELIGDSTENCMKSGVYQGILEEVRGVINQYRQRYPRMKTILTGGDHALFAGQLKNGIFARPILQLEGLNRILMHNIQTI